MKLAALSANAMWSSSLHAGCRCAPPTHTNTQLHPAGRTLCKLHLAPNQLHADINGDGVIDHVMVGSAGE